MFESSKSKIFWLLIIPLIIGVILLFIEYGVINNNNKVKTEDINKLKIIDELVKINSTEELLLRIEYFKKNGDIIAEKRDRISISNGFYIFILDQNTVYAKFLYNNGEFINVETKLKYKNLPNRYYDKEQLWVYELP